MSRVLLRFVALCVVMGLAACGGDASPGGDASAPDVTRPVPDGLSDVRVGVDALAGDVRVTQDVDAVSPETEGVPCLEDDAFFEQALWQPLLSVACVGCHNPSGLAASTEMVFGPGDTAEGTAANMDVATQIALKELSGISVLLLKPSGQHPGGHTGGSAAPLGSSEYALLAEWVDRVRGLGPDCSEVEEVPDPCGTIAPGPPMLRLLNRVEYDRTIEALFGFPSAWGAAFIAENVLHGFDNQAEVLTVPPLLAVQFRDAAEAIAAEAVQSSVGLVPCDPLADGEGACAAAFIADVGGRVFRRPMTDEDVARYQALFELGMDDGGFVAGVELVLTAMLQSPHFLYRSELGVPDGEGEYTLTAWEVASALSYFLWGSMPDAELYARAADGSVLTPDVLRVQAERLLDDPRCRPMLAHFTRQWLDIELLGMVPKDVGTYPEFHEGLREDMAAQTEALMAGVVLEEQGTLVDLLVRDQVSLTEDLALYYGLPAPTGPTDGDGLASVSTEGTAYGGVLTEGSVLVTHAFSTGSSPVHRGKFVREQLLCQAVPPPPPGVVAELEPQAPNSTTRERFEQHASVEPCASCHRLMDPIGFGFEHFDGIGRYRETENGLEIDDTGEITSTASTNGTFEGVQVLASMLAESPEVHRCFARQWTRFAFGMDVTANLACMLDDVTADFVTGDLRVRELWLALVQTPHFLRRADQPEEVLVPELPVPPATPDAGTSDVSDAGVEDVGPSPDDGLVVSTAIDSEWGTGYCATVTVTNEGLAIADWVIEVPIDGTVTEMWNASYQVLESGAYQVYGVFWNQTLAPGESASFGYCASLVGPPPVSNEPEPMPDASDATGIDDGGDDASEVSEPGPSDDDIQVSTVQASAWDAGYCMDVFVSNASQSSLVWSFTMPVVGAIYDIWNATAMPVGGVVYFEGVAWNASLPAGETVSFGFCAEY